MVLSRSQALSQYPQPSSFVNGDWRAGGGVPFAEVIDPANGQIVARVSPASAKFLDEAAEAAAKAAPVWRAMAPQARAEILIHAAQWLREQADVVAASITLELGRPLAETRSEVLRAAEFISWNAQAASRIFAAHPFLQPVGPVLALTPWNVPMLSPARKVSMALAAGCPCILKPSEATPTAAMALVKALVEAGVPKSVIGLVLGPPAEVSAHLIRHPAIRKISLTGSTAVGKRLAALAGSEMKPVTMELGGHAPVIVCDDHAVETTAQMAVAAKFRNCGQICTSPTRFYVEHSAYERFTAAFVKAAQSLIVGDGFGAATQMGPLANHRRLAAMQAMVEDAQTHGATLFTGGARLGDNGCFFMPTVLGNVSAASLFMREEPFGPIASIAPFTDIDEAVLAANSLPVGLAAYVFSSVPAVQAEVSESLQAGVVGVNRFAVSEPDVPFGGILDSGYGREGGEEGIAEFLATKAVLY